MTKGWCPVHDRIVEGRDGTCPECGTPLVDLTARPRDQTESRMLVGEESDPGPSTAQEEESEAARPRETSLWPEIRLPERFFGRDMVAIGPAAIAAILVAAVVASFLVGRAIPRSRDDGSPSSAVKAPTIRSDYTIGIARRAAGVTLRLDRFSQKGSHITLRVTVPSDSLLDIGRIEEAVVAPFDSSGTEMGRFPIRVRTTTTGFIVDDTINLNSPSQLIRGVEILTLRARTTSGAGFHLDLGRVWPAGPEPVPKVVKIGDVATGDDGRRFAVAAAVGWPDRLEIVVRVTGVRDAWTYDDAYTLTTPDAPPLAGEILDKEATITLRHVVFRGVPARANEAAFQIGYGAVTVEGQGSWRWGLGPVG